MRTAAPVYCRWMIAFDLPRVLEIERASFEADYWKENDFRQALRCQSVIGMVAEQEQDILGYTLYELHKKSVDILNFAVDPRRRREGVGTILINKLKYKLLSHRRQKLTAITPESSLLMLQFLRAHRFRAKGLLKNYCDGEDAIAMTYIPTVDDAKRLGMEFQFASLGND